MTKHFDIPLKKIRNSEIEYIPNQAGYQGKGKGRYEPKPEDGEPVGGWVGTAFIILLASVVFAFIIHLA